MKYLTIAAFFAVTLLSLFVIDSPAKESKVKPKDKKPKVRYAMPETVIKENEYYIIGGSYDKYTAAIEYRDLLLENGFGRSMVLRTGNKYRVAFARFNDRKRADEYLFNIRLN